MSKGTKRVSAKSQRRIRAKRKAKQKKLIIIGVCTLAAVAVVTVVVLLILSDSNQDNSETFSAGGQIVQLLDDGRFAASLAHNVLITGTYTKTSDDDRDIITFNTNGLIEIGWIEDDVLIIPEEWDDLCNHGRMLPRR